MTKEELKESIKNLVSSVKEETHLGFKIFLSKQDDEEWSDGGSELDIKFLKLSSSGKFYVSLRDRGIHQCGCCDTIDDWKGELTLESIFEDFSEYSEDEVDALNQLLVGIHYKLSQEA